MKDRDKQADCQADIHDEDGVMEWCGDLRKVLVERHRSSNDGQDGRRVRKNETERERERVRETDRLREVLIYRDAGALHLRLELTANLRVNSLGDKLAELRRKYSWHYAYA